MKKPELLAPAGNLERLKVAINFGADAVYVGGSRFNLRANAINFTDEELISGIKYAHERSKKIYVTLNITPHMEEISDVEEYIKFLKEINVDAVIVTDLKIMEIVKRIGIPLHISTQASTMNEKASKFYQKMGAERVVIARETDINSLSEIIKTGIETEVFIHGAICAGVSGRCVLSNYMSNRDSNRGGCSQSCRFTFKIEEENIDDYTFCTKDLMMISKLKTMIDLGVTSLKIEGRMRSIYYIATVVSIYRKNIDLIYNDNFSKISESDIADLDRCANRDHSNQFFDEEYDYSYQYYNGRHEASNQDFIGIVIGKKDKLLFVEQRNYFKLNDEIEMFNESYHVNKYKIKKIYDEDMEEIEIVRHPRQKVYIEVDGEEEVGSFIRRAHQNI